MLQLFLACRQRFGRDTRGVTMLEYGLIAALIAAVCVGTISALGSGINTAFTNVANSI